MEPTRFTAMMWISAHIAEHHVEWGDKASEEARWHVRIARGSVSIDVVIIGMGTLDTTVITHATEPMLSTSMLRQNI